MYVSVSYFYCVNESVCQFFEIITSSPYMVIKLIFSIVDPYIKKWKQIRPFEMYFK